MPHWTASLFATALEALLNRRKRGGGGLGTVTGSILQSPIKLVAAFVMAPFLALRLAFVAEDPARRFIASIGLFFSVLVAWSAGTFLGSVAGALLIGAKFGLAWGVGFFVGTSLSVTLSVAFSILALNATAYFFLRMSTEEVVAHLRSLSQ